MMQSYDYDSDESQAMSDEQGASSSTNSRSSPSSSILFNPHPHVVKIIKTNTGFGFNVKGQVSEGGQLRSLNGKLYAPLQHVSAVLHKGAADVAGLRKGDRILEVNGTSVEGSTHRKVVDLIKSGGDTLTMIVISVNDADADRYDYCEESSITYANDYSESRSLPISVPSYNTINDGIERFVVFNIHMAGRHLGSRRYSEFVELHNMLKKHFYDFCFPPLPGKWPFKLSDQQLDARRRGLEQYLEKICSVRVIAESDIVQHFLMDCDPMCEVEIRALFPDGVPMSIRTRRSVSASLFFSLIQRKLQMSREVSSAIAIFEVLDTSFERKVMDSESVHDIYTHNYSSASSSCLVLRKFIFDTERERALCRRDVHFKHFCYRQALADIKHGKVVSNKKNYQLKALQNEENMDQLLEVARAMEGYNQVTFPPAIFAHRNRRETVETSLLIDWARVVDFRVCEDGASFSFDYEKDVETRKLKTIYLETPFAEYMAECFAEVQFEYQMMKYQVETQPLPYATIVLHCFKYPAKGVLGLLIGNKKDSMITVTGCVPICHESTPLAPSLELATTIVHAKHGNSLVGVYFSNPGCRDPSLNPYATRLADRISVVTNSPAILIEVMNERLASECYEDRLIPFEKDGDTWKPAKNIFNGSNILEGLQAVINAKLYRDLIDFENHLDNPENDFYNTILGKKILQVSEFRA
ncbi:unnamed protein product [Caenorhabditis bovis]|uniref:Uncharacterized protein n=1 Tax=Caenorhabditis bovis TaxID=2654633 RepID=A0A8S1F6C5_9PELO|nr:unnamed protein product [Caenorhabditis bovis]